MSNSYVRDPLDPLEVASVAIRAPGVLNKYLQSWDCSNLFVLGASAFPHNSAYNPTGPVGALAYWAADAIKNKYMKNQGQLVSA